MTTENNLPAPEVQAKDASSKEEADPVVRWYSKDVNDKLQPAARELLEKYSKIPPEEVESHVYTVREQAWAIQPYPCIGQFRFLDLSMSKSPHYSTILSRLKTGNETLLDLGCCFGQEIRQLVYDGVPSTQLYGCDLRSDYFDCGFDLFRDRDTLKATFFQADIFDPDSDLNKLDGNLDIVYIGSFLHLFNYSQQVEICVRITELLKDNVGSMVVGRQTGFDEPGEKESGVRKGTVVMRHNVESFTKMWEEVGKLTGEKWRVEGELGLRNDMGSFGVEGPSEAIKILRFAVFREAVDVMED